MKVENNVFRKSEDYDTTMPREENCQRPER